MVSSICRMRSLLQEEMQLESTASDNAKTEEIIVDTTDSAKIVYIGDSDSDLIDVKSRLLDNSEVPSEMLENPIADSLLGCSAILGHQVFDTMSDRHCYSKSWEVVCVAFGVDYTDQYNGDSTFHKVSHSCYSKVVANVQSNLQIISPAIASDFNDGKSEILISNVALVFGESSDPTPNIESDSEDGATTDSNQVLAKSSEREYKIQPTACHLYYEMSGRQVSKGASCFCILVNKRRMHEVAIRCATKIWSLSESVAFFRRVTEEVRGLGTLGVKGDVDEIENCNIFQKHCSLRWLTELLSELATQLALP